MLAIASTSSFALARSTPTRSVVKATVSAKDSFCYGARLAPRLDHSRASARGHTLDEE